MNVFYNDEPQDLTKMINSARKQVELLCALRQRMAIEMMEDGKTTKVINIKATG